MTEPMRPRFMPPPQIATFEDFVREVDRIDWYALYSDDYGVASAGEAHMQRVREAITKLGPVDGPKALAYYKQQCPWGKQLRPQDIPLTPRS